MAIFGIGIGFEGLLCDLVAVCRGFNILRCCRDIEICLAIDNSTGFMFELFSSKSSSSFESSLSFEAADVAGEEGGGFLSLAKDEDAVEGVCAVCGVIICHLGSCMYEALGRMDPGLTTSNSGDDISVGDSSTRFDESGLNWYSLGTAFCSLALARVAIVSLPFG